MRACLISVSVSVRFSANPLLGCPALVWCGGVGADEAGRQCQYGAIVLGDKKSNKCIT
jgi:hypothetical protein